MQLRKVGVLQSETLAPCCCRSAGRRMNAPNTEFLRHDERPHLTSTAWRLMHSEQGQEAENTKVRPAPTPHVKAAFPISVGHGCSRLCRVSRSASHAKRDAKSFPVTKSFPVVKGSLPGRSRLARARASHCSRAGPILSLRERRSESRLTE